MLLQLLYFSIKYCYNTIFLLAKLASEVIINSFVWGFACICWRRWSRHLPAGRAGEENGAGWQTAASPPTYSRETPNKFQIALVIIYNNLAKTLKSWVDSCTYLCLKSPVFFPRPRSRVQRCLAARIRAYHNSKGEINFIIITLNFYDFLRGWNHCNPVKRMTVKSRL